MCIACMVRVRLQYHDVPLLKDAMLRWRKFEVYHRGGGGSADGSSKDSGGMDWIDVTELTDLGDMFACFDGLGY
jgi:hypothetical protein